MSFSLFNILNDFIVNTSLFNRNKSFLIRYKKR